MTAQTSMTTRAWAEMAALGLVWGGSFLSNRLALGLAVLDGRTVAREAWA